MEKHYFRTIHSVGANDDAVVRVHDEKLQNYLNYGWADTNDGTQKMFPQGSPLNHRKEVHSQSTTSWLKAQNIHLVTILCCSDEPLETKEQEEKEEY